MMQQHTSAACARAAMMPIALTLGSGCAVVAGLAKRVSSGVQISPLCDASTASASLFNAIVDVKMIVMHSSDIAS
jgi:hypothetical protein